MLQVTTETFQTEVLESDNPVVIDFWAEWCAPCKAMAPIFEDVSKKFPEAKFVKIDADANLSLMEQYGFSSMPTFAIFKNGKLIATKIGFTQKSLFAKFVEENL